MRIIAGDLRGRRLKAPRGTSTRPTSDRVREALFSVIAARLPGASFLDAYAGTGAVGIEALSRGASRSVFVESDPEVARILRGNLTTLALLDRAEVLSMPFVRSTSFMLARSESFDVIFLDPPYGEGEIRRALRLCASGALLSPGGLLVAEHDRRLGPPSAEGSLTLSRSLRYGGTALSFFSRG